MTFEEFKREREERHWELMEQVDRVRKYAESVDGGGIHWLDFSKWGQFIDVEINEYPVIRHWYFAVPRKEDLKKVVRYAVCESGLGKVTAFRKLENGRVANWTFFGEESLEGAGWYRLGVE